MNKEKENIIKEIRKLMNQIEEKKIIYRERLKETQRSDEKLEEIYSEINKLVKEVEKLNEELKSIQ